MSTVLRTALLTLLLAVPAFAQWDNPTPQVLLYGDFENIVDLTPIGTLTQTRVFQVAGKFGQGLQLTKTAPGNSYLQSSAIQLDPRRGSVAFWIKLNTLTLTGTSELFDIYPGPPHACPRYTVGTPGSFLVTVDSLEGDAGPKATANVTWVAGTWVHLVWTWWGMEHTIYVNGIVGGSQTLGSPMVPTQGCCFHIGAVSGGSQDAVLDEFTIYNVTLTQAEVTTLATAVAPGPLSSFATHGVLVDAQWAPGDTRVHVAVDVGNQHTAAATAVEVAVKNAAAATVGTSTITPLLRGFGEVVFPLASMPPNTYSAEVTVKNAGGATLATAASAAFILPSTPWLGNTLALTDTLQPPWTPITRAGSTLGVIGRTIELSGGAGLPQQITSQGLPLLAAPVSIEVVQGGTPVPVTPVASGTTSALTVGGSGPPLTAAATGGPALRMDTPGPAQAVSLTTVANHEARWTGTGIAGAVTAQVQGRLEYDGMLLFTVTLAPVSTPVALDGIRLQMAMPAARAQWMHTATDQRFWWYPYKAATAATVGVFHTNLQQQPGDSTFLPVVVFSDHEVGLEWFSDGPEGWRVDEAQPMQQVSRDTGDIIRLENRIANKALTLTGPLTFTFGLMATPTKPMPADWRTFSVHHAVMPLTSTLHLWWAWPSDLGGNTCRQGDFNLYPVDAPCWNAAWASKRATGLKIAPFTNAHVELPHGTDTWASLNAILYDETQNDGWVGFPTRGYRDYWIYQLNQWFATGGLDAIYIDESYGFGTTQSLLAGGFIKEDGTHGYGFNNQGIRKLLKRVRQLFVDYGLRPLVWIHNTATLRPHIWSFADIMSDGEAWIYNAPTDPDWVDTWGHQLLTPTSGINVTDGGPWLLSIGRTQKFGWMTAFLDYIRFYNLPVDYGPAKRAYHGVLGLLDIIPISYHTNAQTLAAPLLDAKEAFGIGASDVTWQGYWAQTAVVPARADVKASCWRRVASALCLVMNLGEVLTAGQVGVSLAGLGLTGGTVKDGETNAPYTITGGQITMTIPRHDYKLLRMDAP